MRQKGENADINCLKQTIYDKIYMEKYLKRYINGKSRHGRNIAR